MEITNSRNNIGILYYNTLEFLSYIDYRPRFENIIDLIKSLINKVVEGFD